MNNHLVIMAGGMGSRFWPMSTEETPKQFIDVLGVGKTLLQLTMQRFEGICANENVWVVTNEAYVSKVREQLPQIPVENILSEPCRRNTAPCVCYVSHRIKSTDPEANIVVTPSDHIVVNEKEFRRVITSALSFTASRNAIVTLGMKVTRPETGYGYIQADMSQRQRENEEIYAVSRFREKPDLATAKQYMAEDNFFWNAGIFLWNVSTIVDAFSKHAPGVNAIFQSLTGAYGTEHEQEAVNAAYPTCESISVDYAIMEKAEHIFVYPADFSWSDLGTWGALWTLSPHDAEGNSCIGNDIRMIESSNCIVHTTEEKKVVIQGLDGYIVAEKNDTLLICRLSEEQRIKDFR